MFCSRFISSRVCLSCGFFVTLFPWCSRLSYGKCRANKQTLSGCHGYLDTEWCLVESMRLHWSAAGMSLYSRGGAKKIGRVGGLISGIMITWLAHCRDENIMRCHDLRCTHQGTVGRLAEAGLVWFTETTLFIPETTRQRNVWRHMTVQPLICARKTHDTGFTGQRETWCARICGWFRDKFMTYTNT